MDQRPQLLLHVMPSVVVGGDFYDWLNLANGHVQFLVGDVSGDGPLSGALGMSMRTALKSMS